MKTKIGKSTVSLSLLIFLVIACSPYGYNKQINKKIVIADIMMNASATETYNYLENSSNAKEWSTFVKDIIPLNEVSYADGEIGSIRRCYGKDSSIVWDERIVLVSTNKLRELSISNAKGFPLYVEGLITQQIYSKLPDGQSKLSLTLYIKDEASSTLSNLKFYLGAYKVKRILAANLKNIKKHVETRSV